MHYDLIIIGGGPGGYAAAVHGAQKGLSVALIEKDHLGGTCLNRGCVPTKAYLHASAASAAVSAAQARAAGAAVTPEAAAYRHTMLEEKNQVVAQLEAGIHSLMKTHKITVYQGLGTLTALAAPFAVSVNGDSLTADRILIATGSKPARLPVPGCDHPEVWTSDDILGAPGAEPFSSLAIVGGGVIGVEMACVYAKLGVKVTIVEAEKNCLPMMDRDLGRSVEALLKGLEVTVLTGARLEAVEKQAVGFTLRVEKAGTQIIPCDRVLLATGRMPQLDGLMADGLELPTYRRALAVDENYQTSIPGLYAIGDVNGLCQLAHAAHAQGLWAVSHMLGLEAPIDPLLVPSCVYTTPEIASVGLTQEEAKAQGREVSVGKAVTTQNARSLIEGLGRGFIKLVFDKQTTALLGAQLFCGRATDMLGELTLAIQKGLTAEELLKPLRAHPTFYEAITDAVEAAMK